MCVWVCSRHWVWSSGYSWPSSLAWVHWGGYKVHSWATGMLGEVGAALGAWKERRTWISTPRTGGSHGHWGTPTGLYQWFKIGSPRIWTHPTAWALGRWQRAGGDNTDVAGISTSVTLGSPISGASAEQLFRGGTSAVAPACSLLLCSSWTLYAPSSCPSLLPLECSTSFSMTVSLRVLPCVLITCNLWLSAVLLVSVLDMLPSRLRESGGRTMQVSVPGKNWTQGRKMNKWMFCLVDTALHMWQIANGMPETQ